MNIFWFVLSFHALSVVFIFLFGMHIFWFGLSFYSLLSFLSCIIFVVQNSDLTVSVLVL